MTTPPKSISGLTSAAAARVMLWQSGQAVTVPGNAMGLMQQRTITGTFGEITVTNGDGVSGNPTISLPAQGFVVDRALGTYATNADITAVIPFDDTIPQNTEGTEIISVSITPKSTTNRLRCRFRGATVGNGTHSVAAAMFLNTTASAINAASVAFVGSGFTHILMLEHEFVPGATSAQTLAIRVGPSGGGTMRMNGNITGRYFGGVNISTLVVEEIKA